LFCKTLGFTYFVSKVDKEVEFYLLLDQKIRHGPRN